MFDPKLKEALGRVQKPGRYTGGEPGSVYKDKEKVDVRFAFCSDGWIWLAVKNFSGSP